MSVQDFGTYTITTTDTPNGRTETFAWKPGTPQANQETLAARAAAALASNLTFLALPDPTPGNQTYLAITAPTNAQAVAQVSALTQQADALIAQVSALTRQLDAVIRLLTGAFDGVT